MGLLRNILQYCCINNQTHTYRQYKWFLDKVHLTCVTSMVLLYSMNTRHKITTTMLNSEPYCTLCFSYSMCTHPVVFLEPLCTVVTALVPPLWSVLRIKVKEPLSKGKLGFKKKGKGTEAELRITPGIKAGSKGKFIKYNRRWMRDSWSLCRWEQSHWFSEGLF